MSKKVKMTDEQIKESISRDIDLYKEAGYSVEDYVLDTTRVNMEYARNIGADFTVMILGGMLALVGAVYSFVDNKNYKKRFNQINDNVKYRISQQQSLNQGVVTSEDLDAQVDVNVDVNVDV